MSNLTFLCPRVSVSTTVLVLSCQISISAVFKLMWRYVRSSMTCLSTAVYVCNSVNVAVSQSGLEQEYLLLEECESKTAPPDSLWVHSISVCGVLCWRRRPISLHGLIDWLTFNQGHQARFYTRVKFLFTVRHFLLLFQGAMPCHV